jgi:patatin-like phospholipase/acyl hydrolase
LLSLVLLERIEKTVPGWLDKVDLLAGTSTGGIIALGLAHSVPLADIRALYEQKGRDIFDDSWLDNLKDLGNVAGAQYGNKALSRELRRIFGETRLKDLRKRVLIPAFDLDNENPDASRRAWSPKFFHNFPGPDSDGDRLAYKVALYTSAAPTFFPAVDGYIDGGVFANNPSMAALAQTQDHRAMTGLPCCPSGRECP